MLTFSHSRQRAVTLIEAAGAIDEGGAERFAAFLDAEIANEAQLLLLDLQRVDFVGIDGLWELWSAVRRVRHNGGDLRLVAPSERVHQALADAGLDEVIRVFESQAEALGSFST